MKLVSFFFLTICSSLLAKSLSVGVSAKSAILMNADTGAILFEKEAHQPLYPASITKIATALYALEKKGALLDEKVTALHDCIVTISPQVKHSSIKSHPAYRLEAGGSNIGIRVGEVLSFRALLYGLLLSSGNDAGNVIAHYVCGSVDQFIIELNQFLLSKGVKETSFLNPHGLHHPQHQTTAYDMALITKEALKHPFFKEVVKTVRYERPQTNKQPQGYFVQSNRLLKPGQYYYSKAIGVKTGFTAPAGYTLVAAAAHEGRTLIAVLLNCDLNGRYRDAVKLFEIAFAEKPITRTFFARMGDHFTFKVKGGRRDLDAVLNEDLNLSYFPAEEPAVKTRLCLNELKLPITQGERVGKVELVTQEGTILQSKPLYASRGVDKTVWKVLADSCMRFRTWLILAFLSLNVLLGLFYYLKKPKKVI